MYGIYMYMIIFEIIITELSLRPETLGYAWAVRSCTV